MILVKAVKKNLSIKKVTKIRDYNLRENRMK